MPAVDSLTALILLVLRFVALAGAAYAVFHAVRQRTDAFTAVDQLTKPVWVGILVVAEAGGQLIVLAEEGRVAVRNVRRSAMDQLKKLEKDGEISEDDLARAEKSLDATTKKFVDSVDELLKNKDAELSEI